MVILGAGFGGLRAARALKRAPVRVTVVDRRNYHLFQPLLYQIAMAGLTPDQIAYPVRAILRGQKNATFRLAEVEGIDFEGRRLHTSSGELGYDYLVLAMGGATNFFGLESVREHGHGLKAIEDAVEIRNQVLRCFELAVQETDPDRRRALLSFVIVGGGPTGVELAGALSELVRLVLARDIPEINIKDVRILLLEAADRLLADMPERLRKLTAEKLRQKHVEVRFGARVTHFDERSVLLEGDERIPARTLIWAAGVRVAELAEHLRVEQAQQGRIVVRPTLQLPERDEVFVIGDAAYLEAEGKPLPMMAPVAIQQGKLVARNIDRILQGDSLDEFIYRDPGTLATIGRSAAVARLGRWKFSGFFAWVVWLIVHLIQLIGFRNRLLVLINWAWEYLFYERAVRLITTQDVDDLRAYGQLESAEPLSARSQSREKP